MTDSAVQSALHAFAGATERHQWAWCDVAVSSAAQSSYTDKLAKPRAAEVNRAEANPRAVPIRQTADLLIGVLDMLIQNSFNIL